MIPWYLSVQLVKNLIISRNHNFSLVYTSPPLHSLLRYFSPVHISRPLSLIAYPNVIHPSILRSQKLCFALLYLTSEVIEIWGSYMCLQLQGRRNTLKMEAASLLKCFCIAKYTCVTSQNVTGLILVNPKWQDRRDIRRHRWIPFPSPSPQPLVAVYSECTDQVGVVV